MNNNVGRIDQYLCRYGLFQYYSMDHFTLTAICVVVYTFGAGHDVWAVNADDDYHEQRTDTA